jgi:1-acyl-sn-glycerol-3-phosphate acyltransferase
MRFAPRVWKPALSPSLVRWLAGIRRRQQIKEVNIAEVAITGDDYVRQAIDAGQGVMIMPNHSSHADPYVIYAAADKIQTPLYLMATWHVFHDKSPIVQWLLRKHGCFSVDREANDVGAFRLASDILREKPQPLVIFPEGEIYHCNDRVTPFREGAAAIAVMAARKSARPIVCVPCAIHYRYEEDPSEALTETMGELEEAILWRRKTDQPLDQRIYRFAEALLAVKELEYVNEVQTGSLPDRISSLGDRILGGVEARHELSDGGKSIPERVKASRKTIMEKLADDSLTQTEKKRLDDDLEDLFLVVQSFSYPGDYVAGKPSTERLAETIDKFEEDILRRTTATIKARRRATVQFGQPIEVVGDKKVKGQTSILTMSVETAVQSMLDGQSHESASTGDGGA